jgi:hypothetical protein
LVLIFFDGLTVGWFVEGETRHGRSKREGTGIATGKSQKAKERGKSHLAALGIGIDRVF